MSENANTMQENHGAPDTAPRRRSFRMKLTSQNTNSAAKTPREATKVIEMPKPGMPLSNIMMAPNTKAAIPPSPRKPKLGANASAVINARPMMISASPA